MATSKAIDILRDLQANAGPRRTSGLEIAKIESFLAQDPDLVAAIEEAGETVKNLRQEFPGLLDLPETELIARIQAGYVNFYAQTDLNPYLPAAARGPWIVTCYGAVLHDSGGYGMLGFGHAPQDILQALSKNQVMANIMTANFSQLRLSDRLFQEIGHARKSNERPFARFICMNSGSEAVTVALRISDINARKMTDPTGPKAGRRPMYLAIQGGFHGRTERPAMASSSSRKYYEALASFRNLDVTRTIAPNDTAGLIAAFEQAERDGVWFEAMLLEPVMGEGDPGRAVTPEFYALARELTAKHGTLLLIDSIQAGLRTTGCLSIVDYPGFTELPPPDLETYSKALNAGQYPLSILAMSSAASDIYVRGVYGNTKTTNPRALDVAAAVLDKVTPELRKNIRERGQEILERFRDLQRELPEIITKVQGQGLLVSMEVSPKHFAVLGAGQLEEWLRIHGVGVIHGGANSLRFTPHFRITSAEVELLISMLRRAFTEGPKKA